MLSGMHDISESESHSVMSDSLGPHGLYSPWNSPGQSTGVGSLSLLQGIFPNEESNPGPPHCRQILYQLSLQRSPINQYIYITIYIYIYVANISSGIGKNLKNYVPLYIVKYDISWNDILIECIDRKS